MVKEVKKSRLLTILCAVALLGMATPVHAAKANFFERNEQAIIGGSIGVFAALISYILCSVQIANERDARKEQRHHLEGLITELRAWVQRLQSLYEALPFETFQKEADQKIGKVRELLSQDLTKHRDTLSYDVQRVAAEIAKLRSERDKMIAELDKQHAFLAQVEHFVRSVKDQQGEAFLNNIVEAKQDVENMIGQLRTQRAELANQLADVSRTANEYNGTLVTQERALNGLQNDINAIDVTISQRQAQLDKAQRASQDLDREVERVNNALGAAQKQHRVLKSEFDQALGQLSQFISAARSEKSGLEQQVHNAHYQLQDVLTRISGLQQDAQKASTTLAAYTRPQVTVSNEMVAASPSRQHASTRTARSVDTSTDAGLLKAAQEQLTSAIGSFDDAASCRKAYLKFTRKNHPDKGGDKAAFQAVSGLYNLLIDHKLLGRTVSYVPNKISAQLQASTADLKKQASKINH